MEVTITPGAKFNVLTPDEFVSFIPRPEQRTWIDAPASVTLDATGSGDIAVYKCPMGYEFFSRRVTMLLNTAADPSSGQVVLNVAGTYVRYSRSDQLGEFAQPQYGSAVQIPGVQTWGDQQGPYMQNGQVLKVHASGLTANAQLTVILEGILKRPGMGGRGA